MAITFTHQPNTLNFAGNPILAKVRTTQAVQGTEKSFLRIVCEVTFNDASLPGRVPDFTTELSCPVEDGGEATFNFSDPSSTLLNRMMVLLDMNNEALSLQYSVHMSAVFKEVWIEDSREVVGERL